ncbi:MAG: hypothetical protein EXQ52_06055 [Bryobacterales bacterium]|nr:hypothetical protein [Bryobacterales bacterium]
MPELRIPEEHCKILAKLALLTDLQANELVSVVESIPPGRLKDYANAGVAAIEAIDPKEMRGYLETLFSLHTVRAYYDAPAEEFLNDVLAALAKHGESLTETNRDQFAKILARLLGVKALSISVKAYSLQREHPHLFHDAKILADLRPIFDSPSDPPVGLVVAYTLHLVFHKGNHREDLYFALDADDIEKLKTVLERAQTKASSLKRLLSDKGLNQIE